MKIAASIFKTFFLSLCIIANTHFAFAQTASILPPAKTQFLDSNGKPLTSGTVDFYIPSTTTRKTTWQDTAETIANTNPVVLDAGGRALILGSGSYRQVVKDRSNNVIWDQVTSSSGSGGGSTPTATGDGDLVGTIKPWAGMTAPNQYVFTYGQELSRTAFAALFTAITSTQAVFCTSGNPTLTGLSDTTNFPIGAQVEVSCLAAGFSTIISKTSNSITLAANPNVSTNTNAIIFPWGNGNHINTFNVPDFRGLVPAGNNNMGGVASSNLNITNYGTDPNSIGGLGGAQSNILTRPNLPNVAPVFTGSLATITVNSTVSNIAQGNAGTAAAAGSALNAFVGTSGITSTGSYTPLGSVASLNGNVTQTTFSIIQPTKTANFIIKTTPDANSATASGVTSLGGMTGDIACGNGILCTGNSISINGSVNANSIIYQPPEGLSTAQTVQTKIQQRYSVLDFGADPTGVADSAPAFRTAYEQVPYGSILEIPVGKFRMATCRNGAIIDTSTNVPNKVVSLIGQGYTLKTAGSFSNPSGSIIQLDAAIPNTCDFFHYAPTDLTYGMTLSGFAVVAAGGTFGTPVGRHGLFFDGQYASGIGTFGILTGGSAYTNGVYSAVPLTGGSGSGATATVTVVGGIVTSVVPALVGIGYTVGNSLSASAASIGGTGSGFSVTIATVFNSYLEGLTIDNVFIDNMATGYSLYTKSLVTGSGMIALARMSHNKLMQARFENAGDSNVFSHNVLGANAPNDARNVGVYLTQASGATNFDISNNDSVNFNGCIFVDQAIKPKIQFNECEIVDPFTSSSLKQIWISGGVGQVVSPTITGNTFSSNVTTQNIVPLTIDNSYGAWVQDNRMYVSQNFAPIVVTSNAVNTSIGNANTYYVSGSLLTCGSISDSGTATVNDCVLRKTAAGTSQPASPAAGKVITWVDSTDLRFHDVGSAGTVGTTTVAKTCTNQFFSVLSTAGVLTCASASLASISGLGTGVATALSVATSTTGGFPIYAEGTFTPTITTSGTAGTPIYSIQVGTYEHIGRQVTARFSITLTSWGGSPTGNVSLGGLPFTSTSNTNDFGSCYFTTYSVTGLAALNYGVGAFIGASSTTALWLSNGNTTSSAITAAQAGATVSLTGVCIYRT